MVLANGNVSLWNVANSKEARWLVYRRCYLGIASSAQLLKKSTWPSFSVGFSSQDEVMDVARSASQGAHYHADVYLLAPLTGNEICEQGAYGAPRL